MRRVVLVAVVLAVGLVGCGGSSAGDACAEYEAVMAEVRELDEQGVTLEGAEREELLGRLREVGRLAVDSDDPAVSAAGADLVRLVGTDRWGEAIMSVSFACGMR